VVAFLPDFGNEGRGDLGEAVAQFIELFVGDLDVPKCLDGPDFVLELGRVVLGKMGLGVPLHVDDAKLNVGGGEETLVQGEQAGEVILDDDHDTAETALGQAAEDLLPILEVLAARLEMQARTRFLPSRPRPTTT